MINIILKISRKDYHFSQKLLGICILLWYELHKVTHMNKENIFIIYWNIGVKLIHSSYPSRSYTLPSFASVPCNFSFDISYLIPSTAMEHQEKFIFPGAKETQNKLQIFVTSCSPDAFCMPFVFSCAVYSF